MLAKKIVNKSVSFNVLDPFQAQMKSYIEQYPNFSAYMKRLIQRDMEDGIKKAPSPTVTNQLGKAPQPIKSQGGGIKFTLGK